MARKNKHTPPVGSKKHKGRSSVPSSAINEARPGIVNTVQGNSMASITRQRLDVGEVVVSDKHSELPFEIRRIAITTGVVLIVLLALWLIFK